MQNTKNMITMKLKHQDYLLKFFNFKTGINANNILARAIRIDCLGDKSFLLLK